MNNYNEHDDVGTIKGVGKVKVEQFNKKKVFTVGDLLRYYPRSYKVYEEPVKDFEAAMQDNKPLIAVIDGKEKIETKSGKVVMKVMCKDALGNQFMATWFNFVTNPFGFTLGSVLVLIGKCSKAFGYNFITHPEVYRIREYEELIGKPVPKYSQTSKLKTYTIANAVNEILPNTEIKDTLPEQIINKRNIPSMRELFNRVHNPKDVKELYMTDKFLAYEELFNFLYQLKKLNKEQAEISNDYKFSVIEDVNKVCNSLPFRLTKGQSVALNNIFSDLTGKYVSNRLVQGDVGSGKTMIAIISLLYAYENGYQSILLAPTEVLAMQHYNEAVRTYSDAGLKVNIALITGKTTKKEKEEIGSRLINGERLIIIGTHAVINMADEFTKLALLIIDEQHKFGVEQREALKKKCKPHVITMTATPIPRTLSLALYGNGSVSEIRDLPANRKPIINYKTTDRYFNQVFRFVNGEVLKGRQAYIVCPVIEDSEVEELYEVETIVQMLKEAYPNIKVSGVHGKSEAKYREDTMNSYKKGDIDVLVSTTVIEVGINVPNATLMVVVNAERFGLATLHQLRGRVGRGTEQSYCIFVDCIQTEKSQKRMEIITSTNSGFEISEADLKERGAGELLGVKQSGDWNFKKADIYDLDLVKLVTTDVNEYLKEYTNGNQGK